MNWIKKIKSFRNKKNIFIDEKTEYESLSPRDDISNGSEYLKALKWALNNPKIKNIALSGLYGSGKSSVIETFLKQNPSISKKTLRVSMATFISDCENRQNKSDVELDEIEKGVLKQLFYKVSYKDIPQSRFRKLHKVSLLRVWLCTLIFFFVLLGFFYVLKPLLVTELLDKVAFAGENIGFPIWLSYVYMSIFLLCAISFISILYRTIATKYNVKKVNISKDISLEVESDSKETIFNQNMDEIAYFFEETKYSIVVFEDLDRWETPSIFIHLRELNTILNNYDVIKQPIVFIYAVRDDIFKNEDRTKFFDFIIPVVPIINSTNSGEILLQKLEKSRKIGKDHCISESFVLDVSLFISDMRVLQNIYNEFVVYKSTLKTGQDLKLLDEPMLALIIFKNLYPSDFADLQMECGIVKQAFRDKASFISKKHQELQDRINASSKVLNDVKNDMFGTKKSLKYSFLCEITEAVGIARDFKPEGKNSVNAVNFLKDDYNIPNWEDVSTCSGSYIALGGSVYHFSTSNFDKIYRKFIRNYNAVSLLESDKVENEKKYVEDLQHQIYTISSLSLADLIEQYGIDNILSEKVKSNDFLVFFLRRGYINEKYVDYINYFKATSITTDDMNYILGIKNLSPKPNNYKLTRVDLVVERLQLYEFEQEVIYNFDLMEYLLNNKDDRKLQAFITTLSTGSEKSWKFIDEFIGITENKSRFIKLLSETWVDMWNYINDSSILTYERKVFYLKLLISNTSLDTIISLNYNNKITMFLLENENILCDLSYDEDEKVIELIKALDLKFSRIQTNDVSAMILKFIFDKDFYQINLPMIQKVVQYVNCDFVSSLKTKNYSTLIDLNYLPLLNYIRKNIGVYIEKVFLDECNNDETEDAILDILRRSCDNEYYENIIKNENIVFDDISKIRENLSGTSIGYVQSVIKTIVTNRKLAVTWNNLFVCWEICGFIDEILVLIEDDYKQLLGLDSSCVTDEAFIAELIKSNIQVECFGCIIEKLPWEDFDIDLLEIEYQKLSVLIDKKYFNFSLLRYKELEEGYPDLLSKFILNNQAEFMQIRNELTFETDLFEKIILSDELEEINLQILLKENFKVCMTYRIAESLNTMNVDISLEMFNVAWDYIDDSKKFEFMINNIELLDADTFEKCFSAMEKPYLALSDRSRRHDVSFESSDSNRVLMQYLKKIGYITSFEDKTIREYDPERKADRLSSHIVCRVKAINK